MFECTITADPSQLDSLIESFEQYCVEQGIQGATVMQMLMVLEEVASNSIKYGYPEGNTSGRIDVRAEIANNNLCLTVTDDAAAFNPTRFTEPDTISGIEERKVGGLGLYLISQLTDSMFYQRRNEHNVLQINKKIMPTPNTDVEVDTPLT
jgi:anti-sigma regulatory factor (Ser/Thr protein kinase)